MLVHTIPQSLVLRCCKIIAFDGQKNVDVVCIRVTVVKEGIFFVSLGEIFFSLTSALGDETLHSYLFLVCFR